MFHHTPNIEPNDDNKPIIRTLIRKYIGVNKYENDKNILLQSIPTEYLDKTIINKKIKDIEKQMKEYQDELLKRAAIKSAATTGATNYLTFVTATSGNLPQLVNSSITCNPSTGAITGGISGGTF
jgi:methylmalonyl-CoA mutase N-terminal domain/subunit